MDEDADGGKLDEGEEVGAELVIAGGDVPEPLKLIEAALDELEFVVDAFFHRRAEIGR